MNILVACEFSGLVRDAFRAKGHNAISCDLEPSERPGPHYQGDVRDILSDQWDMLIAFPPCTYLCIAGSNWWYRQPWRLDAQKEALEFVRLLMAAPIERIAIENPVGVISSRIRKPDQVIQPYWYGEVYSKKTCLWLKNLPPLIAGCQTIGYKSNWFVNNAPGRGDARRKHNSRTFPSIAQAMADQWLVESAGVA